MRYRTKMAWFGIGPAFALLLAAGLAVASFLGYVGRRTEVTPKSNFSVDEVRQFKAFPVFYAGAEVNGHALTAVLREDLGPLRKNQLSIGFVYGTCEIGSGFDPGGCAPPIEIANEPACARNLGLYVGGFPHLRRRTIRGAPAGVLEGGSRLEIQTGTTTVVIFAHSKKKALSVARSLRGLNVDVTAEDPLPEAALGVVEGKVPCP
jgi:hypothetical protein